MKLLDGMRWVLDLASLCLKGKERFYDKTPCAVQSQSQSSSGELRKVGGGSM